MPERADEVRVVQTISSLDKSTTFHFLTNINNFLSIFSPSEDIEKHEHVQTLLRTNLLDDKLQKKYQETVSNNSSQMHLRPVFHRQQILYLMKLVLLHAKDSGGCVLAEDMEKVDRLGYACLMVNDLLYNGLLETYGAISREHNDQVNILFAQTVSLGELSKPPRIDIAISRVIRFFEISEGILPEFYNKHTLSEMFEEFNGISLHIFLEMVWGTYVSYKTNELDDFISDPARFNLGRNEWASKTNFTQQELEPFYKLMFIDFTKMESCITSEMAETKLIPQLNFTTFRSFPFFSLNDEIFSCVDVSFLVEKASLGIYYTILDSFRKRDRAISALFLSHWGKIFENYVNGLFSDLYPKSSGLFYPNPEFESSTEMEAFDGLIYNLKAIIVIECKGSSLKIDAKYSGNPDLLLDELDKKYGRKGVGISQIVASLETLFNADWDKRKQIRGLDLKRVRRVYPILIVNELTLEIGFANWKLSEWFDEELKSKQIDRAIGVAPLLVLSVQHLEEFFPYLKEGDFSLQDFARFYSEFREIRRKSLVGVDLMDTKEYHPKIGVREIFAKFRKAKDISYRDNNTLEQEFNKFNNDLMDRMDF